MTQFIWCPIFSHNFVEPPVNRWSIPLRLDMTVIFFLSVPITKEIKWNSTLPLVSLKSHTTWPDFIYYFLKRYLILCKRCTCSIICQWYSLSNSRQHAAIVSAIAAVYWKKALLCRQKSFQLQFCIAPLYVDKCKHPDKCKEFY